MAFKNLGKNTKAVEEAPESPVARWEKVLAVLAENGEIPALSELQIHRKAWKLVRAEAHRAKLRALASAYGEKKSEGRPPGDFCARCASRWCVCPPAPQEPPACDPEAIRRLIEEARGIHGAAKILADLPHVQRHDFIVTQLLCVAQAAQAILDQLVKLR